MPYRCTEICSKLGSITQADVTDVEENCDQKATQKLLQDMLHLMMGHEDKCDSALLWNVR